ncbi:MAG: hypothetical protein IJM45_10555 [Clostridia bacterium]|nr:hypothetical protein [Clostridia bacterium]
MYEITVPFVPTAPGFKKEEALEAAKKICAKRVLLAIGVPSRDNTELFKKLAETIAYFKAGGFLTGVWYWAFMVDFNDFTPIKGNRGESKANYCPLDLGLLDFAAGLVKQIAAMGPEMILYDDDFRFGHIDSGFGCVCDRHRRLIAQKMGVDESGLPDGIFEAAFTGEPGPLRRAVMRSWGESMENFARRMRDAADEVDPNVRIGICSCMSVWDTDGTDTFTLAKLLAGNTRPYVRLIGAPYWAAMKAWGNRLQDVIELERMEISWNGIDAEIVSEGDTFPRPRYKVPASYLDIFDTALRFGGGFSGIQKYAFDYTGSLSYETGYAALPDNGYIDGITEGCESVGVRVYEAMKKIGGAALREDIDTVPDLFFSYASKALSANGIPTVYKGAGCAGIAFGENAKYLPKEAFLKPLVLDITAARLLTEKGHDVGVTDFGGAIKPKYQHYLKQDEYVPAYDLGSEAPFCRGVTLRPECEILAEYVCDEGAYPAVFGYKNFIVLTASATPRSELSSADAAFRLPETVWRNYCLPRILKDRIPDLPVSAVGHPDLYIQAKRGQNKLAVGIWNCHADAIDGLELTVHGEYREVCGVRCGAVKTENGITVDRIPAFSYCFVEAFL